MYVGLLLTKRHLSNKDRGFLAEGVSLEGDHCIPTVTGVVYLALWPQPVWRAGTVEQTTATLSTVALITGVRVAARNLQ